MQVSVVRYSEVSRMPDRRIDAECYQPIYLHLDAVLKEKNTKTIEELSSSVVNFGAYSLCNYIQFVEKGIPFLVTEDINNNIIDISQLHYVSSSVHQLLHKSHCKKGQILLTMAGAYLGQAAVFHHDFECSSNQAIAKITLKTGLVEPLYLSTFINSKYGQFQINRLQTGTGQPNLNLGLIQTIIVPELARKFQLLVSDVVLSGVEFHSLNNQINKDASKLLFDRLNLNGRVQLSFWMLAGASPVGIKVGQSRSQQPGYGVICALRRCIA